MPHRGTILLKEAVSAMLAALNQRDPLGYGHSTRVANLSLTLADALKFTIEQKAILQYAALLHDIGKIGLPDFVLQSNEQYSEDEYLLMQEHPQIGVIIVGEVSLFKVIKPGILQHHEWIDGNGYPMGLKNNEICVEARIISVAEAFDNMTNDQPYRKAMPVVDALKELELNANKQFDSMLVEILTNVIYSLK